MYRIDYLDTLPLYKYKYVGSFYDKSILYVVAIPYREGVHRRVGAEVDQSWAVCSSVMFKRLVATAFHLSHPSRTISVASDLKSRE